MSWVILSVIAILIILIVGSVFKKDKININSVFSNQGLRITQAIGDLKIDENNKKWAVENTHGEIRIHDYFDISDVEIIENGKKYIFQDGFFKSDSNGETFGKSNTAINNLSIIISLNAIDCPTETIKFSVPRSMNDTTSRELLHDTAQKSVAIIQAMQKSI